MADVIRTPDEAFAGLPDFAFAPRYREWEGDQRGIARWLREG